MEALLRSATEKLWVPPVSIRYTNGFSFIGMVLVNPEISGSRELEKCCLMQL